MEKQTQQNDKHRNLDVQTPESSRFFYQRCPGALSRLFSLRCIVVLLLSFVILLSGLFTLLSLRTKSDLDAKEQIKFTASIQAYLRLPKPVSMVISREAKLEQDIYNRVGLANTEVDILSMDQCGNASNCTDVKFTVLPVPIDSAISQQSMRSLMQTFLELFAHQFNLTLSTSDFGPSTSFQILKFPGGISLIPFEANPISGVHEILFNFTLNNSISQLQDSFVQLKDQLKSGLSLKPYENVHILLTNEEGSTIHPPVIVQAAVTSTIPMGNLLQQRLAQLVRIIQTSHATNLGLDNAIFGVVKCITLSNYMKNNLLTAASMSARGPSSQTPLSSFPSASSPLVYSPFPPSAQMQSPQPSKLATSSPRRSSRPLFSPEPLGEPKHQ